MKILSFLLLILIKSGSLLDDETVSEAANIVETKSKCNNKTKECVANIEENNLTAIDTKVLKINENTTNVEETNKGFKKCELSNSSVGDDESMKSTILDSIYLNNIHSSVTTNLIEENVSVDDIETDGVDLFEIINSDCGGTKKCPDLRKKWTSENTITIGFLGAYGRSQVRYIFRDILYKFV